MSLHVCFEIGSLVGRVSALCASNRPLTTVNSRVFDEKETQRERSSPVLERVGDNLTTENAAAALTRLE